MQTECPHCHTLFRIHEDQLLAADGLVQCGYCGETFEASVENAPFPNENQLDVFNAYAQEPADTEKPERSTDNGADAARPGEPDEDSDSARTLLEGASNAVIPDAYRANASSRGTLTTLAWSFACLLLIATLMLQYAWYNRQQLARMEKLEPAIDYACEKFDCSILQLRDPGRIELVRRNVYTHPNADQALMVSTTLVNEAPFPQPYPEIQIDFSNVRGGRLASRRFTPAEYLATETERLTLFPPDSPMTFNLEIRDPGEEAITYEFEFY